MKKASALVLFFILLSCGKEYTSTNLKSGSEDEVMTLSCYTYTTVVYNTECWPTGGAYHETECAPVPSYSDYTVCFETNYGTGSPVPVSTEWGSGGAKSNSAPKPPPPPPIINEQQNHAYLCGSYVWTGVGDAYYTQVNGLGLTLVGNNFTQYVGIGSACVMIPKKQAFNDKNVATRIFNDAWANSADQVVFELNTNALSPDDVSVKKRMIALMKLKLGANFNSTFQSPSYCTGNIPYTPRLAWCATRVTD